MSNEFGLSGLQSTTGARAHSSVSGYRAISEFLRSGRLDHPSNPLSLADIGGITLPHPISFFGCQGPRRIKPRGFCFGRSALAASERLGAIA